jgi:hypothetical protein
VFTTNKRGYPVLSKAHQELLATAFRFGVQVVLTGETIDNRVFGGGATHWFEFRFGVQVIPHVKQDTAHSRV